MKTKEEIAAEQATDPAMAASAWVSKGMASEAAYLAGLLQTLADKASHPELMRLEIRAEVRGTTLVRGIGLVVGEQTSPFAEKQGARVIEVCAAMCAAAAEVETRWRAEDDAERAAAK